jgi:ADP-heptose:LPS heptosyltransferase
MSFSHILICRTDNIGDVVLTLPLAGYLKTQFPDARIDVVCRSYAAPIVRHCRFVDTVTALDTLGDPQQFFAQAACDTVIFAFPNRQLAQAARRARIPNRVGTSHRLHHWFTCNRLAHFSRSRSALHEAQLNFRLLRPLGIDHVPALAQIPALYGLSAPRQAQVDALFSCARYNFIVHPKSHGNGREWPLDCYTQLARELAARPDIRLWVTGSAAEGATLQAQAAALLDLPNVGNLCGTLDLEGLMALIGASDGLVASGTGPLHISAALGTPTLGLFPPLGPTGPRRWGALGKAARVLCVGQPCSNCADAAACFCMRAITPQQVAGAILAWATPQARATR